MKRHAGQFCIATAVALLSSAVSSWAQNSEGKFRLPTLISCNQPVWTEEARRYQLEGTTVLQYSVDDEGRPTFTRVVRSSGWKILDLMALRALEGCRFEATVDASVVRTGLKIPYDWKLEDVEPTLPAALISGSCAASEHIERFLPIKGKFTPLNDGILVRFLLDEEGKTFGIKVEETHPAPVSVATAYIQSCRFSPAMLDGRPVRGNLSGWLVLVPRR